MEKLAQLGMDMSTLWSKYGGQYWHGIANTLILAVIGTVIGCLIGFLCGILQTIPYTQNDPLPKRFFLKLIRVILRVYVEVFRGNALLDTPERFLGQDIVDAAGVYTPAESLERIVRWLHGWMPDVSEEALRKALK